MYTHKEHTQRLVFVTFETYNQSDEEPRLDWRKDTVKDNNNENNTLYIHGNPWIKSDGHSIRNSCNVYILDQLSLQARDLFWLTGVW